MVPTARLPRLTRSAHYAEMTADLGIDTHLHALRHYSATALITAGVDVRTVAERLGHSGGEAPTPRVYAAWLAAAGKSAAGLLGGAGSSQR